MEAAVTKGEFASIIGVSPGRVSQYLAEGKISAAALMGSGRNAKIIVEQAKADLRLSLDVGQRLGNGIETRLDEDASSSSLQTGTQKPSPPTQSGVDYEIKQQKLEQLRRNNRSAAIAEAADKGRFIETEAARAELNKLASSMMMIFEGCLNDFATAVSAEFKVPARDVLHLLRGEFLKARAKEAKKNGDAMADLPETIESVIAANDIDAIN